MSTVSRRTFLSGTAATAAAVLAGVGFVDTARADPRDAGDRGPDNFRLTVMGTTDLHGNVFNWDYYKAAEYGDTAHNDVGLAKVSTLITALRTTVGGSNTLLIDRWP